MLKLYRFSEAKKEYWETWDNGDDSHTIHWGELGTTGQSKIVDSENPEEIIQDEINSLVNQGFDQVDEELTLIIEFEVDGMGNKDDIDKRHRLEDRMNETLGWAGLGNCDGGSIGSGSMEVCCYVVDFAIAKAVIEADLKGTEFENYSRIYCEEES